MKKFNYLSVVATWSDGNGKTIQNKMKVKGQIIEFRNTFRVETKEILDKLLEMKKGRMVLFKKKEKQILQNALLKIQRERCKGKLTDYQFTIFKGEKKEIFVGRI